MILINRVSSYVSWAASSISRCLCKSHKTSQAAAPVFQELSKQELPNREPSNRGGASNSPIRELESNTTSSSAAARSSLTTSWDHLRGGDVFSYRGTKYRICKTAGDGACAIHAIFGQKNRAGVYSFLGIENSGSMARQNYVQSIRNTKSKAVKDNLTVYLAGRLSELLIEGMGQSRENQALVKQISENSKDLIPELKKKVKGISAARDEMSRISRENAEKYFPSSLFESLYSSYASQPAVLDAYLQLCLQDSYYFSDQEIGVMAELFDKKIVIFGQTTGNIPTVYNNNGKDEVLVHFANGHYSRIELLP